MVAVARNGDATVIVRGIGHVYGVRKQNAAGSREKYVAERDTVEGSVIGEEVRQQLATTPLIGREEGWRITASL